MSNASTIAVIAILAVVITGYGSYYFTATPLDAQVSTFQTSVSTFQSEVTSYQSVVSSMSAHPSTTTITTTSTSTSTSTSTFSTTYTTFVTVTTTHSFYPPSNSSYVLTYVSGTVNQSQAMLQCGYLVLTVDITYEIHQQLSTNLIQWAQFPSGKLMQPNTQKVIMNQAYLTIDSTYNYGTGFCPNDGSISSVTIFVTDPNSNQLSPGTYFTVNPV